MFKNFIMKQMLKRQMKGVPEEEQDRILKLVEDNPKFFENIATEVQKKVDGGKDQMAAAMEVMREHQDEVKKLMSK